MSKIRVRLTIVFIVLIGLSVMAAGIFMARMVKNSQLGALKQSMTREMNTMLATYRWNHGATESDRIAYFRAAAEYLKESENTRVTFIRSDGKVLVDSDSNPATMDNHLSRKEIKEARTHKIGSSIRYSHTIKQNMLYVAVPVDEQGKRIGYLRLSLGLKDVEASIDRIWSVLILGLFILFVIAGIVSYRLSLSLTRPLEQITDFAKQITMMNYRSRVKIVRRDEIGQLAQAINKMADSLQFQMNRISEEESRLKSVIDTMISGIVLIDPSGTIVLLNRSAEAILGLSGKELLGKPYTDAKQQFELIQMIGECMERQELIRDELVFYYPEERILEINLVPMLHTGKEFAGAVMVLHDITAIRRLERMRSEFVANVSHELKTPVAAVKGFAETLLNGAMADEEVAKSFLQIIYDESDRLNRLIGDILELSKIESKRASLLFSPVHLRSFIERIIEVLSTEASKKRIELNVKVDDDLYMEADEDRLRQILINLLSNGISYTPEGGAVKVKVEAVRLPGDAEDDHIRMTIADTGIGIPKKDLPRIFERFYRVDKARSRSSGGTGLGLSIVKHLVELHNGTIRVESIVGAGTTFIIELPVLHEM